MLNVSNLTVVKGGKTIISGVSLNLKAGDKLLVKGESGAGKSTLIKALMLFEELAQGHVEFNGEQVTASNVTGYRHNICYIGQKSPGWDSDVMSYLMLPFTYKINKHLTFDSERLNTLLQQLNLPVDTLTKQYSELSGGEQQRITIIQGMLLQRNLFFLDEVTAALDKNNTQSVLQMFANQAVTWVAVAHTPEWEHIATKSLNLVSNAKEAPNG